MLKPILALSKAFRGNQSISEFQKEIVELKNSCPKKTVGKTTSFYDFVNEVGTSLSEKIDWS